MASSRNKYKKEGKVNRRSHTVSLRSPRCAKDGLRDYVDTIDVCGFNLREVAAEIANNIGAFKVSGKAL